MSEKPTLYVHRLGDRLFPESAHDAELLRGFDANARLKCVLTRPRNPDRLRFYWACLGLIRDNLEGSPSVEKLHEMVKVMLGYTVTVKLKGGPITLPGSIAFDQMSESEFKTYLEDFKTLVRTRIIPGIGTDAFEAEALEMLK